MKSGARDEGRGAREDQEPRRLNAFHLVPRPSPLVPDGQPAIRLGLRMISGFAQEAAERLITARAALRSSPRPSPLVPSPSLDDLAQRANLSRHDLRLLAEAGALESLAGPRHNAAWLVAASL